MTGRRPPAWLLLGGLVPSALVAAPVLYVGVRAWKAGPSGLAAELLRPYAAGLLLKLEARPANFQTITRASPFTTPLVISSTSATFTIAAK